MFFFYAYFGVSVEYTMKHKARKKNTRQTRIVIVLLSHVSRFLHIYDATANVKSSHNYSLCCWCSSECMSVVWYFHTILNRFALFYLHFIRTYTVSTVTCYLCLFQLLFLFIVSSIATINAIKRNKYSKLMCFFALFLLLNTKRSLSRSYDHNRAIVKYTLCVL